MQSFSLLNVEKSDTSENVFFTQPLQNVPSYGLHRGLYFALFLVSLFFVFGSLFLRDFDTFFVNL